MQATTTIWTDIKDTYQYVSDKIQEGCDKAKAYYKDHEKEIKAQLPRIQKIATYTFGFVCFVTNGPLMIASTIVGYVTSDKVLYLSNKVKGIWKKLNDEEKLVAGVGVGILVFKAVSWTAGSVVFGLTLGSYISRLEHQE